MPSVTQRIKMISQPKGGYLNPKLFEEIQLESADSLNDTENIHASLIGLSVDYMTRLLLGVKPELAFRISLKGAFNLLKLEQAIAILSKIKGLDDISIIHAIKIVGYDVAFRSSPLHYKPVSEINPDAKTIENVRILVNRSIHFFNLYGPILLDGFTFKNGYTELINAGDGDFITSDTLWDLKVSISTPTKDHTLQLLVYYLMGLKSIHSDIFESIKYLGIFNPRLNRIYRLKIAVINKDIIDEVNKSVIGY